LVFTLGSRFAKLPGVMGGRTGVRHTGGGGTAELRIGDDRIAANACSDMGIATSWAAAKIASVRNAFLVYFAISRIPPTERLNDHPHVSNRIARVLRDPANAASGETFRSCTMNHH
jgi:hypothetical protein